MRRALRKVLPALSYHFDIKGDDLASMPFGEINAYLDALHELTRKR